MEESNPLTESLLGSKEEEQEPILPLAKEDEIPIDAEQVSALYSDASDVPDAPAVAEPVTWERGERQPPQCRDAPYAVLFYIQFFAVTALGVNYSIPIFNGNENNNDNNSDAFDKDYAQLLKPFLVPCIISAAMTVGLIFISLAVLIKKGRAFITCSVWTSAITSLMIGLLAFSSGSLAVGGFGILSALFGVCYAFAVRSRIPFAAANLNAGASSIRSNGGIMLVTLAIGILMFAWTALWSISLIGILDIHQECDNQDEEAGTCITECENDGWILPFMFLLFWNQQVFKNIIHTTVAGIVGTWYFAPQDARSFCSNAIKHSTIRSMTKSFGSICFGSLLVAIIQTLDFIVQNMRNERNRNGNNDGAMALLLCCLDCLLQLLQGIIEYFNKWAFVYVGVYGYPFLTAGKKVMTLFEQRGWTVIINDNLIRNALGMMCFAISLVSSAVAFACDPTRAPGSFAVAFVVSLLLSMTMMSVVDSAVSTVIVCFAEAPEELENKHPSHNREMKEAWTSVYQVTF
jgi:hypothetical protein